MKYFSTRDCSHELVALADAAFMGLARDGGLFMPERIPQVDMQRVEALAAQSYADMALYLAKLLFDEVDAAALDLAFQVSSSPGRAEGEDRKSVV